MLGHESADVLPTSPAWLLDVWGALHGRSLAQ